MPRQYKSEPDRTMKQEAAAPGMFSLRRCWACNQSKSTLGGRLDKRTRLWRCAACVPKNGENA